MPPDRNDRTQDTSKTAKLDQRQVSVMDVFRAVVRERSAREDKSRVKPGTDAPVYSRESRDLATDATLKSHVMTDLASLMDTIRLDAVIDLDDWPYVKGSIINFGFEDLSTFSTSARTIGKVREAIRSTLLTYEPRLIPDSIGIEVDEEEGTDQRIGFEVTAELIAVPFDIPVDFVAEVDIGAGKMAVNRNRSST